MSLWKRQSRHQQDVAALSQRQREIMQMKVLNHFAFTSHNILTHRVAPIMLAAIALAFAAPAAQAATPITDCGTVISQPGRYFLANDLQQCPGFGVSITVSYVEIELRGHTIQATFGDSSITAAGGDAGLTDLEIEGPGTVTGGIAGINFGNVHRSRVHNLVSVHNRFGMTLNAGDFSTAATFAATPSTDNEIRNNVFTCNLGHGITVNGANQNRFIDNNLSGNGLNGTGHGLFLFTASNNIARHNTAVANSGSGIDTAIFGSGNLIDDNTALANGGSDLNDENGDCTHNAWTGNTFNSNSPACIQ